MAAQQKSQPHKISKKIAGAIILTSHHIRFLPQVIEDSLNQTIPFSEIHIIASGMSKPELSEVHRQIPTKQANRFIVHEVPLASAGRNRNFALQVVSDGTEILVFHDADDRYFQYRNEQIVSHIESGILMILHLAVPTPVDRMHENFKKFNGKVPRNGKTIGTSELRSLNKIGEERMRRWELSGAAPTALYVPSSDEGTLQHAHVSIVFPKKFGYRFHENHHPRNEDSLLVRDVVSAGDEVKVIMQPLSLYVVGTSVLKNEINLDKVWYKVKKTLYSLEMKVRHSIRFN